GSVAESRNSSPTIAVPVFDIVGIEPVGEPLQIVFIIASLNQIRLVLARWIIASLVEKGFELFDHVLLMLSHGLNRCQARHMLVDDTVVKRQGVAIHLGGSQSGTATAALLNRDADGAVHG